MDVSHPTGKGSDTPEPESPASRILAWHIRAPVISDMLLVGDHMVG